MKPQSKYSEKLRDPRWQKKRLEVMERDEFTCQRCYDSESTLNVHHWWYEHGKDPWDYPENCFVTLCEECHAEESQEREKIEAVLIRALREIGIFSYGLNDLACAFSQVRHLKSPDVTTSVLMWGIEHYELLDELYFQDLMEMRKRREAKNGVD